MLTLKKSLGQHFLKDEGVAQQIVEALCTESFSQLLEIGPGGGALTKYLVRLPGVDLKCVEIDREKADYLAGVYPGLRDRIIVQDILVTPPPFSGPFAVTGNFPYNISTEIVFKMLDWKDQLQTMVGMFQKEVAQRLAACEGNKVYGVTSVLTQAFFKVDYLFEVPEQAFNPPPKVKSAVVRFTPLQTPVEMSDRRQFTLLVKTAFNQRRKTLRNAVRQLFDQHFLGDAVFNKRAEELSVADFGRLSFLMKAPAGRGGSRTTKAGDTPTRDTPEEETPAER